jgi:enoyl-CoA hydratase
LGLIVQKQGRIGCIRLNRPTALHALNTIMCLGIIDALDEFERDEETVAVVFDHAEGRGFCAGGDIRMLAESGQGDGSDARAFFHAEYRMNHRLFHYAKPTVAVMDGITMGGGVGIALPCRYRIATENTRLAMPETGIGLFPDVGGSYYLSRLPGRVGTFMALTGARLDGAECLAMGLATHYEHSAEDIVIELEKLLLNSVNLDAFFSDWSTPPAHARIADNRDHIDRLFAGDSVAAITSALEADGGDWAAKELATLKSKSPLSCAIAMRQLAEGARIGDFADIMRMEYRIAVRVLAHPDFIEGVRAVVIDKDNAPNWVRDVTDGQIDAVFAPLPDDQEWTPL